MGTTTRRPGNQRPRVGRIDAARLATVKEQQILVNLVQQLADSQFRRADQPRSERLWQELAQLQLDPERATHLLYAGVDMEDRQALVDLDGRWCGRMAAAERRPWLVAPWLGGGHRVRPRRPSGAHRSAPPAAAR
ncbi:hypothetical protein [Cyanobium sp. NIES-981]|uniref:hypothetical protein n=1 Tax=Cyanobium sp. NIES-981 TaxID=1851505 RepID=UPI0007DD9081|nr:hypothetical protein [Cyanobium sp. NIES-981]SBO44172.1 conserved protein of unknown function [Cyanobium sp. NIES-981]